MATPSNNFGVTTTTVRQEQLPSLPSLDTTALQRAIDWAASEVCQEIAGWGIPPVTFTSTADPDGYNVLHELVSVGAVFAYLRGTSGSSDAGASYEGQWVAGLNKITRRPQSFALYPSTGGANAIKSQMSDLSNAEIDKERQRLVKPELPAAWRSL